MKDAPRKVMDCRNFPSVNHCTLSLCGTEEEVLDAAVQHAVAVHGHAHSPELRQQLRLLLKNEEETKPLPI